MYDTELELIAALSGPFTEIEMCGSKVTCNPPPLGTDTDYLVYCDEVFDDKVMNRAEDVLMRAGFVREGNGMSYDGTKFVSWRRVSDNINMIVTPYSDFAKRHRAATALCTRLNLLDKNDRIALFQAVLYGDIWKR